MTRDEILTTVLEELRVAAPDAAASPDETAELRGDLGVDSLAVLELVARLEYRFGMAVPDDDWPHLTSIGAIADYLVEARVAG